MPHLAPILWMIKPLFLMLLFVSVMSVVWWFSISKLNLVTFISGNKLFYSMWNWSDN